MPLKLALSFPLGAIVAFVPLEPCPEAIYRALVVGSLETSFSLSIPIAAACQAVWLETITAMCQTSLGTLGLAAGSKGQPGLH